ncbi:uncharacterized protein LOC132631093 [Lycium barbarum]|uniref:uncharacterized protein LOC132631093 n=1 Tax=Lycium barbarum TaxID=112863 RepID=UPI00293E6A3A|nr:uncharacterized protein LOC132631093 [Lycium barbarum]
MNGCYANCSNKIWIFWNFDVSCSIYANEDQLVTCKVEHNPSNSFYFISVVYAKSTSSGKEDLWGYLRALSSTIDHPWAVCGNFNSIITSEEKQGGKPHRLNKSIPFIECLQDCGLMDMGYVGCNFTWCNERSHDQIIWKRLDMVVVNDNWNGLFPITEVLHLPRVSSDHCPILISYGNQNENHIKYFRFLNFWVDQDDFLEVVKSNWINHTEGNVMWNIQQKMKNTSKALSNWSRNNIGDIFLKEQQMGDLINQYEESYLQTLNEDDRMMLHKYKAELIVHHKKVDSYWRQKANLKWEVEGDNNTKFFHSVIRDRRSRLHIHRIQEGEDWIEGEENIATAAINFYQDFIFSGQYHH